MSHVRWAGLCALLLGSSAAVAEDWPAFRGPTGQGLSSEKDVPVKWDATSNVVWKVAVPAQGWSSPIVWRGRVFLTGTSDGGKSCRVVCVGRGGKVLWDKEVHRQEPGPKRERNSDATPTPATDGKRVYAVFADGTVVAVDYDGHVIWINRDVRFYSQHGLGASPRLYRGLLLMSFDGSSRTGDKTVGWQKPWDRSFLLALDPATGKERWRGKRGLSRIAHVTPVVMKVDGKDQVISPAGDVVQGFDPANGKRLWSVRSEGEGVVPSPAVGEGLVFTASGFGSPAIRAVRPGGKDTKAEVVWEHTAAVPMIPSLLYVKPHLYTVANDGFAQCLEARSGKVVWKKRLGGSYSASPVYAGGRIYFLSDAGETTVIEAGPHFKSVARNPLGERCQASPAVSGGRIYVRTEKHLFCIGKGREGR
jgi:outer membrane protein assembly factor BamB